MSKIEKVISISLDDKTKNGLGAVEKSLDGVDKSMEKAEKTSQSLKVQLRELQKDLLSGKFTGKEFDEATKKAGGLKDAIGDLNARVKVLGSDTKNLDGLISAAQGLAGGFAIAQGAAGLLGGENEDLQKSLLKVQSSMAILNGLQSVANVLQSESAASILILGTAQKAYNFIVGESTGALKGFRLALAATGIGILVIALAELVANWDAVSEAIGGATKEMKSIKSVSKDVNKELTDVYDNLYTVKSAFDQAARGAISKKEALRIYNETLGDTLGKAKTLKEAEELYAQKTPDYIKASFLRAQSQALIAKAAAESVKIATGEAFDLSIFDQIKVGFTQAIFGASAAAETTAKIMLGNKKDIEDNITLDLKLADNAQKEADKIAIKGKLNYNKVEEDKTDKTKEEAAKRRKAEIQAAYDLYYERLSLQEKNKQKIKDDADAVKKEIKDNTESPTQKLNREWEEKKAILIKAGESTLQLDAYYRTKLFEQEQAGKAKTTESNKKTDEERIANEKAVQDAKYQLALDGLNLISGLAEAFAGTSEKQARKAFEIQKAVSIAQAIISGIEGTQNAYTTAQKSPITALFPGYPLVQAGLAGAFSAVKVALITKQQFKGTSTTPSGNAGGSVASPQAQFNIVGQSSTNQLAQTIAGQQQQPVRAYVVGSDVTSQQALDRNKIQNSTFL